MDHVQQETMTACIFYFDVIGVREAYPDDATIVTRLQAFQRSVRGTLLPFGERWSTLITLYDNVWARINVDEANPVEHIALTIATSSMRYAQENGFHEYFGACTYQRAVAWEGKPLGIAVE